MTTSMGGEELMGRLLAAEVLAVTALNVVCSANKDPDAKRQTAIFMTQIRQVYSFDQFPQEIAEHARRFLDLHLSHISENLP